MKRHALFVGVNDYADTAFKNLRYSLSDAVALSGAFAARGFDVEVLSNPKADSVLGAVERKAAGLGPGDVFLFFFAGHGFTAPDGSHLLICSNDRLAYLRHNRAGIPVDLLEEITNGRGCNRAFLLDACRTDVFAGVESRGAETRDLALVSLPDAKVHAGTCCVLRSCDRFCPAMEFDDLGHGVFTRAVMDMLGDDSARAMPFGEAFVAGIRSRMHVILSAHSVVDGQNPCFQTNGEAFFLFDGVAPVVSAPQPSAPQPSPSNHRPIATPPTLVLCPVCGKKNRPEDTFNCRECGKDNLCLRHQDEATFLCTDCVAAKRKERAECEAEERRARAEARRRAREEEERKAREEAERRVREEAERKAREDAERRVREETERKAREEAERNARKVREEEERKIREQSERNWREEGGLKAGTATTITLPGGVKMEMIYCPPGEFLMGSPTTEEGRGNGEIQHRVRLTKGFWLGKYPVTQGQWKSVMGNNPSEFTGDDSLPVERVSWNDCKEFIAKVNASLGCGARLPTEAEWEYACRAGTTSAYFWGNALNGDKANCIGYNPCGTKTMGPSLRKTTPVGRYAPNPWGFYDMHGNVWECCADLYGDYSGVTVDPTGPSLSFSRVVRGGSWCSHARDCRSASRGGKYPGEHSSCSGFRLSCSAGPRR